MKEAETSSTQEENISDYNFSSLSDMDSMISNPTKSESVKTRSNWITNVKGKSISPLQKTPVGKNYQITEENSIKSNPLKINRRISLTSTSFIPKCLTLNNFYSKDVNQTKSPSQISQHDTLYHQITPEIIPLSTSAVSNSDRHSNTSISSLSEKSAIGKSINAIKKTFTLFSDFNSAEHLSDNDEFEIDFDETLTDDTHSLRRTLSFTDSDRRQVISFVLGETENIRKSNSDAISPESTINIAQTNQGTRQRSRTIDSINKVNDKEDTGVLSSITNLVKVTKSSSSLSLRTMTNRSSEPSFSLSLSGSLENSDPGYILETLLGSYSIVYVCEALSIKEEDALKSALSTYLHRFYDFTNEPLDFSMRKFLMINYLPKETQQIDRVIYAFAERYYECNPHVGFDLDTVYILTYSLTMVHTDKFNPNNKRKMSRFEFVENVDNAIELDYISKSIKTKNVFSKELLGYFYDNVTHCPLIKISPEQSKLVLQCLKENQALPYPKINFMDGPPRNTDMSRPSSNTIKSSSSIPRSVSQLSHTPIRKKNSSFLWSASNTHDPYEFIIKNNTKEFESLRLLYGSDISISYDNPFLSPNNEIPLKSQKPSMKMIDTELDYYKKNLKANINSKLLNSLWRNMTEDICEYVFKIEKKKASFLLGLRTETIPLNDTVGTEYFLIRVLKVGIIYIQETSTSAVRSSSLESVSPSMHETADLPTKTPANLKKRKLKWKSHFAILTPLGLFLFDDISSFRMRFTKSSTKCVKNPVVIEPTSLRPVVFKDFKNKNLLDPRSTAIETNGFTPFSYFRSEKAETYRPVSFSLCLDSDSFATRKCQNLNFDKIINQPSNSRRDIATEININSLPESMSERGDSQDYFSVSGKKELNYTFFIYGKKSKNLCMVASEEELSSWIYSINAINTLRTIDFKYKPLDFTKVTKNNITDINHFKFYEVNLKKKKDSSLSSSQSTTEEDKSPRKRSNTECLQSNSSSKPSTQSRCDIQTIRTEADSIEYFENLTSSYPLHFNEYQKILEDCGQEKLLSTYPHNDLLQHLYAVQNLKMTMPLQKRTKEDLLYTIKIIAAKLEWIWYEKCKSLAIALINEHFTERLNVIDGNNI
ncbi:hypothetical protein CANINC_002319 [Pichia inconspicua]|uniref:SEC7 domain-containing protein n=1 Tax=Pichia inconspicua TaxID=52247 RepID=A0A4T0X1K3_9ASCO|nr:hypothetical protein CANINC_002319 [[Candida] inconspicua]